RHKRAFKAPGPATRPGSSGWRRERPARSTSGARGPLSSLRRPGLALNAVAPGWHGRTIIAAMSRLERSPEASASGGGALDISWVREQFPSLALRVGPLEAAFFDNPAGTQVPLQVERAIGDYFARANANVHGPFLTSQRTDALVERARVL